MLRCFGPKHFSLYIYIYTYIHTFLTHDLSSFLANDLSSFLTNDLSSFLTNDLSSFLTNDLSSSRGDDRLIYRRSKSKKQSKSGKHHTGEKIALFCGGHNVKNGQQLTKIFPKRTRQRSIISVIEMFWALCRSKHLNLIPSLVFMPFGLRNCLLNSAISFH